MSSRQPFGIRQRGHVTPAALVALLYQVQRGDGLWLRVIVNGQVAQEAEVRGPMVGGTMEAPISRCELACHVAAETSVGLARHPWLFYNSAMKDQRSMAQVVPKVSIHAPAGHNHQ